MLSKRKTLGVAVISSAVVSAGASFLKRERASRIALSASNLFMVGWACASQQSSVRGAENAVRKDLRDQKLLIKDLRNSEIQKHRRLEKYVGDLATSVSKAISSAAEGKSAVSVARAGVGAIIAERDLSKSFDRLTKRVARNQRERTSAAPGKKRILFVSSNGAGLGHLTRLSAIDRQMDAHTMIYTMSSAYHRIGKSAKDIIYFPSHGDLGMDGDAWNNYQEAHFDAVVAGFKPHAIVFDGTYIYRGVVRVARRQQLKLVWIQRGCWKPEVDQSSKQRHNAKRICDAVIVPGDYGCVETVDLGEGLEPIYVPPITLPAREDLLDRNAARTVLGLPLDKKLFLVQLGAGVINDIEDLRATVVRTVQSLGDDWCPVLVRNPLSSHAELPDVLSIQAYPLGIYYNAFDAGAFAAGYNTVQESIELGLPGLFIPNLSTKTDDQLRRAEEVARLGMAFAAVDFEDVVTSVNLLADSSVRNEMRHLMREGRRPDGAEEAAKSINNLISS